MKANTIRNFKSGMILTMDDGWTGTLHQIDGDTVVAIQAGVRPNDWLKGYRAFNRRLLTRDGKNIRWKASRRSASAGKGRAKDSDRIARLLADCDRLIHSALV